jgi:hypothetical protein
MFKGDYGHEQTQATLLLLSKKPKASHATSFLASFSMDLKMNNINP